jgi:ABC-type lipoprotein release transport system permease subunit
MVRTVRFGIVALLAWGVLIALVGVLNSVFMTVLERTSEIGLQHAVGCDAPRYQAKFSL